jgi:hypothetical protein
MSRGSRYGQGFHSGMRLEKCGGILDYCNLMVYVKDDTLDR